MLTTNPASRGWGTNKVSNALAPVPTLPPMNTAHLRRAPTELQSDAAKAQTGKSSRATGKKMIAVSNPAPTSGRSPGTVRVK